MIVPRVLRNFVYATADRLGLLLKQRDDLTPSASLLQRCSDGSKDIRDFVWIGEGLTRKFIDIGLKTDHHVLDVGCGIGRVALPIAKYLTDGGRYEGFDIVADSIAWCNQAINRRFPHARFQRVDLYSERYNPKGRLQASEFQFPYPDASFDFVIAMSLFTHMLPADLHRYFEEIARVLRPRGTCIMTFFLLDAETPPHGGKPGIQFPHADGCRVADEDVPERAVGYDEDLVRAICDRNDLAIVSTTYGSWSGKGSERVEGFQDCIVTTRK